MGKIPCEIEGDSLAGYGEGGEGAGEREDLDINVFHPECGVQNSFI